ncbi:MAG: hypothetical protein A2W18_03440 [Candidatus Muproteobacteria bacterium RBG_16_60_9]|uniref:Uncharacterized protein n=1 Tax=Candidatus Muproteobacteria bacterium RBG_16_60_9 TaxID=1817755 RepID=A0A1F6VK65_9PROT|nr:MAG: hypothetical protein A2W18_03440 [Candidatus Muproteobacteria bacterium RBG_16_60_9]
MGVGKLLLFALLAVVLAACSAKPFEYRSQTEIPEGPGMFTTKEGAVVLYSDKDTKTARTAAAAPAPADYREFQDFREFKRWREANRDSAEYREFRDWQEWKAFRAGKERAQ